VLVYKIVAMLVIDAVIVAQCYFLQEMHKLTNSVGNAVCYFWSIVCFSVLLMNYVFMANTVGQRFAKINECLK
jgi:hypothetical protein